MAGKKFYVVWRGRKTGVFDTWEACKTQIEGFPQAAYKSFLTKEQAELAFRSNSSNFIGSKASLSSGLTTQEKKLVGSPILESISVDGAWNTATGVIEYQGVYTRTKELLFRQGPYEEGTNNVAEFLAIVHALAYCKVNNLLLPIYSDSRNALGWVKNKEMRTNLEKTEYNTKLFELMDRAVKWLHTNSYQNKLLKWETKAWGENPADFGRK